MANTFGSIQALMDKQPNNAMMNYPLTEDELSARPVQNYTANASGFHQQVKLVGVQSYPNNERGDGSRSSKRIKSNNNVRFSTVENNNLGEYMLHSIEMEDNQVKTDGIEELEPST